MKKAIIIGGTGQIGYAIAALLLQQNWQVVLASRNKFSFGDFANNSNLSHRILDRRDDVSFSKLISEGADLLIDLVAFGKKEGVQLLSVQHYVKQIVVLSSSSVYCDDKGRTLDEASANGFPCFPDPILETNATVKAGTETYSTNKIALEKVLLQQSKVPITIIRPCAIHGIFSHHPREWWFVKRMLDNRKYIPLAYEGKSVFHTSSALNIAKVVLASTSATDHSIINVADKEPFSVFEIGTTIREELQSNIEFITKPYEKSKPYIGFTPWSVPQPFVLDTSKADKLLGVNELHSYEEDVKMVCEWLKQIDIANWEYEFPQLAVYPYNHFDYEKEDYLLSNK